MTALDLHDAKAGEDGQLCVRERFTPQDIYPRRNLYLKFLLDRLAAACVLVVVSPVFLLCVASVWLEGLFLPASRGPVFITEERYSAGRPFAIIKFRSCLAEDAPGRELADDEVSFINKGRQTRVGKYLRKFYLAELPQLITSLRGKMSIVGPRPWEIKHTTKSLPEGYHAKRLLRGGLCGPVQATKGQRNQFKNNLEMEEVLARNYLSLSALGVVILDLRIMRDTLRAVFRAQGL